MPYESEADCATGQAVQESEARYEESKLVAWSPAPFSNISTNGLWRAPTKRTEHKPLSTSATAAPPLASVETLNWTTEYQEPGGHRQERGVWVLTLHPGIRLHLQRLCSIYSLEMGLLNTPYTYNGG